MARYAFTVPILPGQEEANRRFAAEMAGPRHDDHAASRARLGITSERVWHQVTPQGTISVVYLEANDLGEAFSGLATSRDPFDVWWRSKILDIHGLDMTQPLPGPMNEPVHDFGA